VGLPFSAVTHKVVSKMTYSNLSSGTLNSTIVSGAGIILLNLLCTDETIITTRSLSKKQNYKCGAKNTVAAVMM